MDLDTHNRLFKNIDYNTDRNVQWHLHSTSTSTQAATQVVVKPRSISASTSQAELAPISDPIYAQGVLGPYEARIRGLIGRCTHVQSTEQLVREYGLCV